MIPVGRYFELSSTNWSLLLCGSYIHMGHYFCVGLIFIWVLYSYGSLFRVHCTCNCNAILEYYMGQKIGSLLRTAMHQKLADFNLVTREMACHHAWDQDRDHEHN